MTARPASSGVSMDVLSVLRLLARHWRVTVPAALLTVLLIVAAFRFSSPTYEATGSIVLLSPRSLLTSMPVPEPAPAPTVGQNPFARYGDLAVVADILARVLDSDSKRAEFESQGVTGYDVVVNRFQRGPVVDVTGQGPNPEAAIRSTEIVLKEVNAVLSDLQEAEGADPNYFIHSAPWNFRRRPPRCTAARCVQRSQHWRSARWAPSGWRCSPKPIARRRTARPDRGGGRDPRRDGPRGASNGSRKTGWCGDPAGIAVGAESRRSRGDERSRSGRQQERSKQEPASRESSTQDRSTEGGGPGVIDGRSGQTQDGRRRSGREEPARRKTMQQERRMQESAWQKTSRRHEQVPTGAIQ